MGNRQPDPAYDPMQCLRRPTPRPSVRMGEGLWAEARGMPTSGRSVVQDFAAAPTVTYNPGASQANYYNAADSVEGGAANERAEG